MKNVSRFSQKPPDYSMNAIGREGRFTAFLAHFGGSLTGARDDGPSRRRGAHFFRARGAKPKCCWNSV
jgi:hypothetical protein